jgi:hypothetical protein
MEVSEFKKLLKEESDGRKVSRTALFSSDVWLVRHKNLGEAAPVYDKIKDFFASHLEVQSANVAIVGSAKIGFSLNPKKAFEPFDDEDSDIDVILVSKPKFEEFWAELVRAYYSATPINKLHYKDIFRKFLAIERDLDIPSDRITRWHQTMDSVKRDFFTEFSISNPIRYRVYESWDAVMDYHASGMNRLRSTLFGANNANIE